MISPFILTKECGRTAAYVRTAIYSIYNLSRQFVRLKLKLCTNDIKLTSPSKRINTYIKE